MNEWEVKFIFDGFNVTTSVVADTCNEAYKIAALKLCDNGLEIDQLQETYEVDYTITAEHYN